MNEANIGRVDYPGKLTFEQYSSLASESAKYMDAPDPELILRSGLVEEAVEIFDTDPADRDEFQKEIGDLLWYLAQIAKIKNLSLTDVANVNGANYTTFSDFQKAHVGLSTLPSFQSIDAIEQTAIKNPQDLLGIAVIRILDTLNPQSDELWQDEERPSLLRVLNDGLSVTAMVCNANDIELDIAAQRTLDKNKNRQRQPHVIDEQHILTSSKRVRLNADRHVRQLLINAGLNGNYINPHSIE